MKTNWKWAACFCAACVMFTACDDTTDSIGTSLTDNMDMLKVSTDTFEVTSRSFVADSVLSRNTVGYLGKIKDPETGNYIVGDFMAQFGTLENYTFPEKDSIVSVDASGDVVADSCHIRLFYTTYYGDSLATMNLTAHEMSEPMKENTKYYSNFDPKAEGLVRQDGLKINKTYTLVDLSIDEDERADEGSYTPNIKIDMNKEYVDKDGVRYNNFGTYIMRQYYKNPDYFKNSYNFIHNVCPGFYFEMNDGLGSMAYVYVSQLNVYFRFLKNDSVVVGASSFVGTEEVIQSTRIANDANTLKRLVEDKSCTYIKSPAGIFTELTIPVDDIMNGHRNDTINTAKIVLPRINNTSQSEYTLGKKNSYTFNNISTLVKAMDQKDRSDSKWNKAVIIPVTVTYNTDGEIIKVAHDMSMTSTRLVGGSENPYEPLTIDVIYSKFK